MRKTCLVCGAEIKEGVLLNGNWYCNFSSLQRTSQINSMTCAEFSCLEKARKQEEDN